MPQENNLNAATNKNPPIDTGGFFVGVRRYIFFFFTYDKWLVRCWHAVR